MSGGRWEAPVWQPPDLSSLREQAGRGGVFRAADGELSFTVPDWADVAWLIDSLQALTLDREELLRVLRLTEWGACEDCGEHHYCPVCFGHAGDYPSDGHKPECPVAAALARGSEGGEA